LLTTIRRSPGLVTTRGVNSILNQWDFFFRFRARSKIVPVLSHDIKIESFAHDSGGTLVRAEYGYPKGIFKYQQLKKKSAATALIVFALAHTSWSYQITGDCQMTCLPDS
jgi:hypothetical protein